MTETKQINPKELASINDKDFYSDKSEPPKEVLKLSEKLKNMEPKSDSKTDGKRELVKKADEY